MKDKVFDKYDIEYIENEILLNPIFKYYGMCIFNVSKLKAKDIVCVSDKNLILTKGNAETAYQHIKERWTCNKKLDN